MYKTLFLQLFRCGDGVIFAKDEGFTSSGLTATSPIFKAFKLIESLGATSQISYKCYFANCNDTCAGVIYLVHFLIYKLQQHIQNNIIWYWTNQMNILQNYGMTTSIFLCLNVVVTHYKERLESKNSDFKLYIQRDT